MQKDEADQEAEAAAEHERISADVPPSMAARPGPHETARHCPHPAIARHATPDTIGGLNRGRPEPVLDRANSTE